VEPALGSASDTEGRLGCAVGVLVPLASASDSDPEADDGFKTGDGVRIDGIIPFSASREG